MIVPGSDGNSIKTKIWMVIVTLSDKSLQDLYFLEGDGPQTAGSKELQGSYRDVELMHLISMPDVQIFGTHQQTAAAGDCLIHSQILLK